MSIASELSGEFPRIIRSRGDDYFEQGLVRIKSGSAWEVIANVRGSKNYQVMLLRERYLITGRCSCPYFETDGACKHIWATIREADEIGYLKGNGSIKGLVFIDAFDEEEEEDAEDDEYADGEFDYEEDPDEDEGGGQPRPRIIAFPSHSAPTKKIASWKDQLQALGIKLSASPPGPVPSKEQELFYLVDVPATISTQRLILEVLSRTRKADGKWGVLQKHRLRRQQIPELPDPADRQILASLAGAREQYDHNSYWYRDPYDTAPYRYSLIQPLPQLILPTIARTGRLGLRRNQPDEWQRITWEDNEPWVFWVEIKPAGERYEINGALRRGQARMELSVPVLLLEGGIVLTEDRAVPLDDGHAFNWVAGLRRSGAFSLPKEQIGDLLTDLLSERFPPRLDLPEELRYEEAQSVPRPSLTVKSPKHGNWSRNPSLRGQLSFDYAVGQSGGEIASSDTRRGIYLAGKRQFLLRDFEAESQAAQVLSTLGFRYAQPNHYEKESAWELAPKKLPRVVRELVNAGWHIEAEGKVFRNPGEVRIQVSSGIDWFELHGTVDFGDTSARLPELLAALRRGDNMVKLDDGSFGMLPEEWLKKYGLIAGLGEAHNDHLRFKRTQVGVLDALLAAQPEARFDETFALARNQLKDFAGVTTAEPPAGFTGQLRPYQKDGLGWMHFLRQFGFGGCLADDMGVGKTVQVLALLEERRALRELHQPSSAPKSNKRKATKKAPTKGQALSSARPAPSLVVVPKSLVFNWKQEAARFAPRLRVLEHVGQGRQKAGEHFDDHDLIITTYGTLRRDAVDFKDVEFDYLILDEAQAIKNAETAAAKAARLLHGHNRLALSGTPVENHLGELWSLFEFLNPGMLGAAAVFKLAGAAARNPDEETRKLLSQALRPFILRRTKDQVAKDLPAKLEQTLFCELEPKQRKMYNELRDHYRNTLLDRIAREGIAKSKMHVLEALLRLRQAACHPGLIDKKRVGESSAKLDMLLPQLTAVIEEGHKVLLFSQFTSLLAIVRSHLDKEGVVYEYLDGKTRDRQARVERFQTDPNCKLFLISLKAGGLGLNLTAAEYVYLLDPWWNPAVEAQAIDRAHRIGQLQQVFAYRLIAKDTVEEKVLQLQNTKRDLADAIINADNSLIRSLGKEDLELLLS